VSAALVFLPLAVYLAGLVTWKRRQRREDRDRKAMEALSAALGGTPLPGFPLETEPPTWCDPYVVRGLIPDQRGELPR
jgi:hypothetical protein